MTAFIARNANGDIVAEYPDFEIGTPVTVLPDRSGAGMVGEYVFAGPTRHPYAAVIRDVEFGTTVHVERERLVARANQLPAAGGSRV